MALTFGWTCLAVFPIRLMPTASLDLLSLTAHGKWLSTTCGLFAENIPRVIQTFWRRGRANIKQARRKKRRIKVKRKHLHPIQQLLPLNRILIQVDYFIIFFIFWHFDHILISINDVFEILLCHPTSRCWELGCTTNPFSWHCWRLLSSVFALPLVVHPPFFRGICLHPHHFLLHFTLWLYSG